MNTKKRQINKRHTTTKKRRFSCKRKFLRKYNGGTRTYKYNTLPFGKVSDLSVSQDIENRIYNFFGITKINLDIFLNKYNNRIVPLLGEYGLTDLKKKYLDNISKFQLVDIIYNPNKKLKFVYNHSIGKPETITAGKNGYHIYIFIKPENKDNGKTIYKYELMGIVTNL